MPRHQKERSIFVDPDPYTAQIIAEQLLCEDDHLYYDRRCTDGTERTVWEFTPRDMPRLIKLMMMEGVRMEFFVESKDGRLVPISWTRTPEGVVFSL